MDCLKRGGRFLAVSLLLMALSLNAATLQLGSYLDPNPAPGQTTVNGFVAGQLSGAGALDGLYYWLCWDYDHSTANGATLTGSIVAPNGVDQIVQGALLLAYAGLVSTPLDPAVDTLAYATWKAKTTSIVSVPDVLGSFALEASIRANVVGNLAYYTSLVQANVILFTPTDYKNGGNQGFGAALRSPGTNSETPEPGSMFLMGSAAVLLGLKWRRSHRGPDPEPEPQPAAQ